MGQIQINEDACIRNWTDKSRLTRIRQIYNSHEVSEMDFETTVLCVKKCTQLIHTNLNQRLGSWDKESDWQRFMGHKFSRNKSSPVCVYMYMYTDSHAHTHTRTHTRTHAQTHTHTHTYTCMHMCVCVCDYVCDCVCVCARIHHVWLWKCVCVYTPRCIITMNVIVCVCVRIHSQSTPHMLPLYSNLFTLWISPPSLFLLFKEPNSQDESIHGSVHICLRAAFACGCTWRGDLIPVLRVFRIDEA